MKFLSQGSRGLLIIVSRSFDDSKIILLSAKSRTRGHPKIELFSLVQRGYGESQSVINSSSAADYREHLVWIYCRVVGFLNVAKENTGRISYRTPEDEIHIFDYRDPKV